MRIFQITDILCTQVVRPLTADTCEFTWLMDCDYRGWIPSSILDVAMPVAQTRFVESIRYNDNNVKHAIDSGLPGEL